jgi:hypothetical protein
MVAQPFAYVVGSGRPLVIGDGKAPVPLRARITVSAVGARAAQVLVESDEPLTVRCGETSSGTPARLVLDDQGAGARFVLEDDRSKARVEVLLPRAR